MSEGSSYRQILRSSSIIGGASVINILVGLLRTKVVAVLLGPAGIGLIGLYQSLVATASAVSSLGVGTVGTRQIAEAAGRDDAQAVNTARRALFWGTLGMAAIGAMVFWLLRHVLAEKILGDPGLDEAVGWLAIGVALTVGSGSQGALLNGLRRISDIARVSILSALLSTVLGIGALWLWGEKGLIAFILSAPLSSFLLGNWFVSRLPKVSGPPTPLSLLVGQWKTLAKLGAAFMVAGLAVTIGHLAVRTMVQRELGAEALGHFQAAWMISTTYIGFVLQAMGTDYYPRLTAAIHDNAAVNRMVNEQTEVALLLGGAVFLAMLGLAPWVIELLYSSQFEQAVSVLRWQVLGDILKVASWPLGFIILAAGDGRTFMLAESLAISVFVGLTWFGLPIFGIEATGIAFLGMYSIYLPAVFLLARRRTGFRYYSRVWKKLAMLLLFAIGVAIMGWWSEALAATAGLVSSMGFGVYALCRLVAMSNTDRLSGGILKKINALFGKIGN